MNTLFSLTSRSVRVFFQTPDTAKGVPESIDSGRRNSIKAGLTGLLVVATATSAVSALAGEVDKWAWQVVETPFGKLSFAQIQKHPERNKILDGMKDADYNAYDSWQSGKVQAVKEANKGKLETQQVAIARGRELDNETLETMLRVVKKWWFLRKEDKPYIESLASWPPPNPLAEKILKDAKFA
jgi:hypothetical protein